MDKRIETYCGLSCSDCSFRESNNCQGCVASEGHPFHGKCDVAECAKSKGRRFCGECGEFPCELLKKYAYDKDNGDDGARIEKCTKLKKILVAEGREGVDPIAICGCHCDYCLYSEWCGGCRSSYNCCSYATLFEDNKCPNLVCAYEKKLDGCYECDELEKCTKGFFTAINGENGAACKSKAIIIKKYGKEKYTEATKAQCAESREKIEAFYKLTSVEECLAVLEAFIQKQK